MSWRPRLVEGDAPLYIRIADSIENDVEEKRLSTGDRLPPHRELAAALSLSPGTIAKAYREAETRGLMGSHVGRGSFIMSRLDRASTAKPQLAHFDLARNLPPSEVSAEMVRQTLSRVQARSDLASAISHSGIRGLERTRKAAAEWLKHRHGIAGISSANLIQSNGSMHAVSGIFGTICGPGNTVLCETATFHGLKMIANAGRFNLEGVAMDHCGIVPQALAEAAVRTSARTLYLVPTLQNPTSLTMDISRRKEVVDVARKMDLTIVEDDTYRTLADQDHLPPTLWELAPERTFYVASLSKTLCHGLRLGFILPARNGTTDALLTHLAATGYAPPAVNGYIFAQWVEDGTADALLNEIITESKYRLAIARRVLGARLAPQGEKTSLHVWMPMSILEAERTAGRALRAGVEVTPADAPIVSVNASSGLRLCLGAVKDRESLERALTIVAQSLAADVVGPSSPIF